MKELFTKLKRKKEQIEFTGTILQSFLLAFLLNLLIEMFSQGSILKAIFSLFTNPLVFLYNSLIIMVTLSIAFLFKRRLFVMFIISIIWIIIGVTNFVVLLFRITPFTAIDILLLKSVISIIPHYLNWFHYILIGLLIFAMIIGIVRAFKKLPLFTDPIHHIRTAFFIVMLTLSTFGFTNIGTSSGLLSENFGNLANAFHQYGLPYCFVNSIINTGIRRPKLYSKDVVNHIVDYVDKGIVVTLDDITPTIPPLIEEEIAITPIPTEVPIEEIIIPKSIASRETPNIIMVQLESFFDPATIIDAEFTEDPIPYFRYLKENYTSGWLNVPSVGAGTANTEFEVITGMNLDYFGPGEYPYKTILQSTTCESINYNLKPLGYKTHAIHNNIATFYDRHTVFSQLGFDTFTSIEYMHEPEMTPLGWAKDSILTEEILKALKSTEEPDLIYTISVQGHGVYPSEPVLDEPKIDLALPDKYSKNNYYEMLYYINQLNEMDQFLYELISYLKQYGEDTVLVLYGDHLPSFPFKEEDLTNNSLFQTEYIIWSNFELEKQNDELEAFQLYSYVFERLGINEGLIPKFHQTQKYSDIYLEQLKILEYDMLYGNLDCYGGINPFTPTDLIMGIVKIPIYSFSAIIKDNEKSQYDLKVIGDNFNKFSYICINDEPVNDTVFTNHSSLTAENITLKQGDKITVSQIAADSRVLSTSEPKYFND